MRKLITPVLVTAAASMLLLSACSSKMSAEDIAEEQIEIAKMREEARKERIEQENERMEDELSLVPDWFLTPPGPDGTGIYAVGTAHSKSLGFAVKKARLQAYAELAKQYKLELSGQERSRQKDIGIEGDYTDTSELLIDAVFDNVALVGVETIKNKPVVMDGQKHIFMLVKLPYDEFNRMLQQQRSLNNDAEFRRAFDDLEARLERRRQNRMEDEQIQYEREKETMASRVNQLQTLEDNPGGRREDGSEL
ncbi:hypothetical protein [Motilimonas eburnea]|uniref:hypothetical protein n=1 Tax=Motilimonas eburnea TaxID=1737488 RepID=UPI001E4F4026|nr:hypothetical protein [Motilimonas eburnea]MCE2571659.1 hypothetical protein [Motilimonas eburnea]